MVQQWSNLLPIHRAKKNLLGVQTTLPAVVILTVVVLFFFYYVLFASPISLHFLYHSFGKYWYEYIAAYLWRTDALGWGSGLSYHLQIQTLWSTVIDIDSYRAAIGTWHIFTHGKSIKSYIPPWVVIVIGACLGHIHIYHIISMLLIISMDVHKNPRPPDATFYSSSQCEQPLSNDNDGS